MFDLLALHIPDGFLSNPVAALCWIPAIAAIAIGLRKSTAELIEPRIPLLGVTAAFIFAAQMLNFPIAGGTSGHFLGAALAAILLGPWIACVAMAVVIGIQAFVFADGGIIALGANILNMGVIGALVVGYLMLWTREVLPKSRGMFLGIAGVGAWTAVMAGALAASIELALSGTVPLGVVLTAMLGVHSLIGIGEAVVTVVAVGAVLALRPDLIAVRDLAPAELSSPRRPVATLEGA
jgi:cobalt/nickel transport system permease protein